MGSSMKPRDLAEALIRPRRRPGEAITPDETLKAAGFTIALHRRGDRKAPRRALLVHGWEADHRDMLPLAETLAASGFHVLLPDLPAHGGSSGETVMIPQAASVLVELGNRYGDFDLCVGHSVGSATALVALDRGLRSSAVALLAPPLNYVRQMTLVAGIAGAPEPLIAAAFDVLRVRCPDLDSVDSERLASGLTMPGIVAAAGGDEVLDPDNARRLVRHWPLGLLVVDPDATHRSILKSRPVIDAIIDVACPVLPLNI
jgi:hypothetical protein